VSDAVEPERALRQELRAADLLGLRSNTSMNSAPIVLRSYGLGRAGERVAAARRTLESTPPEGP
jgi:hypothetical protein